MCFSATASFGSAAVLISLGASANRINKNNSKNMFVAMPLIFGFQQIFEGFVWITLGSSEGILQQTSVVAFLFFALIFWPSWLPWAICRMEKNINRKMFLKILGVFGVVFSIGTLSRLLTAKPQAAVLGHSIAYSVSNFKSVLTPSLDALVYLATALLPFFISSDKKVRVTGVLFLGGLVISHMIRAETVTSVWCFFAALTSLYIVFEVFQQTKSPEVRIFNSVTAT